MLRELVALLILTTTMYKKTYLLFTMKLQDNTAHVYNNINKYFSNLYIQ